MKTFFTAFGSILLIILFVIVYNFAVQKEKDRTACVNKDGEYIDSIGVCFKKGLTIKLEGK